jgi:ceramide glucosyltransferase
MLFVLIASVCTFATLVGMAAVWTVTARRRAAPPTATPPVSILKPLCGADDALEANLDGFFRQRYPEYELIFGVEGAHDPAIPVVEGLRRRYPHVPCRLVVHQGGRGINPKVSNLRHMLDAVQHDVLLVSDSNIAVSPDYLAGLVALLDEPKVGVVTSLFCGVGEESLGATLESLHLNGPVIAAVAASQFAAGRPVTVGKSLLFRRSTFERLGGFESVASILAEDYVLGRMFREAGYQVRVAPEVVHNVVVHTPLSAFLRRHQRWGLIRFRLNPVNYALEPLGSPLAVALLAPLLGASLAPALLWALALGLLRDAFQWWRLRGPAGLARALPYGPLKELLILGVWATAPFVRHVSWRGRRVRLSAGTRLYAQTPAPAPELPVVS